MTNYTEYKQLNGHSDIITSIDFSENYLASSSHDKTIIIWNLKKFEKDKIMYGHSSYVNSV